MKLVDKQLLYIIDSTPLVSIDLILMNKNEEVLLGKRVNRPAQGYWFVPGGRIKKNEKISDAMIRISLNELGVDVSNYNPQLLGVFEHIYDDNYLGKDGVNTHYVVLAYMVHIEEELDITTDNQHSDIQWWSISRLLDAQNVHENTKTYLLPSSSSYAV